MKLNHILLAAATLVAASSVNAADGVWTNTDTTPANVGWTTTTNWSGGIAAGGAGSVADFSTLDLTADNVVAINAAQTVGTLKFGDTTPSHNWVISLATGAGISRALTMDNGANAAVFDVSSGTTVTVNGAHFTGSATGLTLDVGTKGFNKTGAGTLQIAATKSIFAGSGLVTVGGGTLSLNQSAANTTFVGSYQVNATATLAFGNGSLGTGTGVIGMNGGTLKWNAGNTQDISSRLAVQAGTTATFDTGGNNVAFGSAINFSTGGLVKTGAGTLAVGAFTGSGLFRVSEGIVTLQATGGSTNFTGTYQVDSGATLTVGVGGTAGNLYGSGAVANQSVVLNGGTLRFNRATGGAKLISAVTGSGTVSVVGGALGWEQGFGTAEGTTGTIGGATNFVVESGTATMSLANTYTGGTTVGSVAAGTLVIADGGTIKVGAAGVTVNANSLLTVNGKLELTTGSATIANAGTLTLNGTSVLDIGSFFNGQADGSTYQLITGATSGTFGTILFDTNAFSSVTFNNADGKLSFVTAVPEPSTYGLLGAGALAGVAFVRRRRKHAASVA